MFEVRYLNSKACVRVIKKCKTYKEINEVFNMYGVDEVKKRTRVQVGVDYRLVIEPLYKYDNKKDEE